MASMGESLAGGLIFVIPAIILLGQRLSVGTIFLVSLLGGAIGLFFVVPLRRYLTIEEHGRLLYPEGMATSEILVNASEGGEGFRTMTTGLGVGAVYKFLSGGFGLWREETEWVIKPVQGTIFGLDVMASLFGVGYIIGIKLDLVMFAGSIFAWFGLIPIIKYFGANIPGAIFPSATPIAEMDAWDIWSSYIKYIGAGAVAAGGIIGIIKSIPAISKSVKSATGNMNVKNEKRSKNSGIRDTNDDIPLKWITFGIVLTFFLVWLVPMAGVRVGALGSFLAILFSFLFAVVSARVVGIIGTSNNPISGMTIATLLFVTAILKATGRVGNEGMIAALVIGGVVCIATAIAGGAAQGMKTTFIVGGNPRHVELSMILAFAIAAIPLGYVILLLDKAYTIGSKEVLAPQATLMSMIVQGIMNGQMPWILIIVGVVIGIMCELVKIPVLPFALGIYLPIHLNAATLVGGVIRSSVERKYKNDEYELKARDERGVLLSSGLVAGDALIGILIAAFAAAGISDKIAFGKNLDYLTPVTQNPWTALVIGMALAYWMYKYTVKENKNIASRIKKNKVEA
jgi:putative OPT family oligopeptide transporter